MCSNELTMNNLCVTLNNVIFYVNGTTQNMKLHRLFYVNTPRPTFGDPLSKAPDLVILPPLPN